MIKSKLEQYAEAARKWILERYDQKVVDSSEVGYRYNDQISCTKVVNASGVVKGILTVWEEGSKLQYHFDKQT